MYLLPAYYRICYTHLHGGNSVGSFLLSYVPMQLQRSRWCIILSIFLLWVPLKCDCCLAFATRALREAAIQSSGRSFVIHLFTVDSLFLTWKPQISLELWKYCWRFLSWGRCRCTVQHTTSQQSHWHLYQCREEKISAHESEFRYSGERKAGNYEYLLLI